MNIETIKILKEAPTFYLSPLGRSLLTHDEVKHRKFFNCIDSISNKVMIFRKFWEISQLDENEQSSLIKYAYLFLKEENIIKEELQENYTVTQNL